MVFSSSLFLFLFLPITLAIYYIAPMRIRNFALMCFSLFFYAWGEPINVSVMIITIVINYLLGIAIDKNERAGYRKLFLMVAVVVDLGLLFYYKYFNFFIDTMNGVFSSHIEVAKVALPIGISFYTFQIMSYVIDVYRRQTRA